MVHSKKAPEAVNLQAVQAALRMLQMNTTQEGVENYFGNELSLLAKMAGFQLYPGKFSASDQCYRFLW